MRWIGLLVGCWACGKAPSEGEPEPEPPEEEEPACLSGCPVEPDETCDGCAAKIARCCYADLEELRPLVERAMQNCDRDPACVACCNECAAKSCDQLVDAGACPAQF